jgi:hypothetical protein
MKVTVLAPGTRQVQCIELAAHGNTRLKCSLYHLGHGLQVWFMTLFPTETTQSVVKLLVVYLNLGKAVPGSLCWFGQSCTFSMRYVWSAKKNSIQSPWYFFVTWDRPSMNKSNTEDHHIPCWSSLKVRTEHVPILHNAVDMSTPQEMKLLNHQFSLCFTLTFPESHQYSTSKKVCFHVWSFRQTFIMAPNENTRRRADFPTDSSESLDLRHVKIWSKATPPYQPYKVVPPQW